MLIATREQMLKEAVKRMRLLKIIEPGLCESVFKKHPVISCSNEFYLLQPLTPYQQKRVNEFEAMSGNFVYHVIQNPHDELGLMLTFLYVSPCMDEWTRDWVELKAGEPLAYVVNCDDEVCSEYGHVGVQNTNGALTRTW